MRYDLVVLGGGPAGLSAACAAAEQGKSVILLDEQAVPGGQIYRNAEGITAQVSGILGATHAKGLALARRFRRSGAVYEPGVNIWSLAPGFEVAASSSSHTKVLAASRIVIAVGAMERPMPCSGWTRPGVLTAGAVQVLLKSEESIPTGKIVLAGVGPLLLLAALQLIRAGANVSAIIDLSDRRRRLPALGKALLAPGSVADAFSGISWLVELQRAGVKMIRADRLGTISDGDRHRHAISFARGRVRSLVQADWVVLHSGVVPQTQAATILGCALDWNEQQKCWHTRRDNALETSVPGVYVAGDCGGIIGVDGAHVEGELAGLAAAASLDPDTARRVAKSIAGLRSQRQHIRRRRAFIDILFRPSPKLLEVGDDVIVCRCEEISAGRLRTVARMGATTLDQAKFMTRCGMGPCQGRGCATAAAEILSTTLGKGTGEVGFFRVRPPLKPVALARLAEIERNVERSQFYRT